MEAEQMPYNPDGDAATAGVEKLKPFGILATIDTLADGDMLRYDSILLQCYQDVFAKLKYDYEKHEYMKRYEQVMKKKK